MICDFNIAFCLLDDDTDTDELHSHRESFYSCKSHALKNVSRHIYSIVRCVLYAKKRK